MTPTLADLLLGAGANPNAVNALGVTPLMLAAVNGSDAMTERLLKAGANAAAARDGGATVLMLAARSGNLAVVKRLVAAGADVNAATWQGDTALMFAAAERHPAVTSLLLEVGADKNARTEANVRKARGMAPAEASEEPRLVNKNQAIAVAQLPKDGDYDPPRPEGGFTPLLHAAMSGDLESVRALVAAGADVNQRAADGSTGLIVAIVKHHPDIALFLLDKGADPNVSEPGFTALHAASVTGQIPVVQALLDKKADPNAVVTMPLRLSAAFIPYNPDLVAGRLSQVGATPYMQAAKAVNVEMMQLLVEAGRRPEGDRQRRHERHHAGRRSRQTLAERHVRVHSVPTRGTKREPSRRSSWRWTWAETSTRRTNLARRRCTPPCITLRTRSSRFWWSGAPTSTR